ncbi:hypothetical protein [Metapseudomonas otitidis]|uniref:hypothetical protein n=1 Tax=Metapseudomonas otitidis TaxID=319939 RepID=UPI00244D46D8|nr:hypothetical protein [Pseudomonas otitidis]MDH0335131.1 hypothetical protein [Pseudomonas otitidis]
MSRNQVTEEMLKAAVSVAIERGLLPKAGFADEVAKGWDAIKAVVQAALDHQEKDEP